jgi:uncharacterized membrane protein
MPEAVPPPQPPSEREPSEEVAHLGRNEQTPVGVAPDRPRVVLEGEIIQETREIRQLLRRQVMLMRHRIHIGPLPPAKDYKAYEAVHPGSADRILKMAESEQAHGQQMERDVLAADKEIASRGQHYALFATMWLGGLGAVLGYTGHDWLGGAFVVSSLVPIVAHFLARTILEPKNKPAPDQRRPEESAPPSRVARDEPGSLGTIDVRAGRRKAGKTAKESKSRKSAGSDSSESGPR